MDRQDIIVAPATPPGEGGVAIVRLSGDGCLSLALDYFRPTGSLDLPLSHVFYHGFLQDSSGLNIDEIMFVFMANPRSFTAEDVVEIHCHGGYQTVSKILQLFIGAGARLARPGEFSYRAFINGRLDLSQAEAIADLIHARSETAQSLALSQMGGQLSRALYEHRDLLKESLALIEAWIDFPEEELPQEDMLSICKQIETAVEQLRLMVSSYNSGRLYAEGVSLLLLGKPNVGKSSLMNSLLGEERAIVTEIAGTTRDLLEEGLVVHGLPVRLIDSAGIRETTDPVEVAGVLRARDRVESADLVLLLFDGSRPFSAEDLLALEHGEKARSLVVVTKSDLPSQCMLPAAIGEDVLHVSVKSGQGLDQLRESIYQTLITSDLQQDNSVLLTSRRHWSAASSAIDSLERFLEAQSRSLSLEFLATDLREALHALGDITGETTTDDILDSIFSRFCIGK